MPMVDKNKEKESEIFSKGSQVEVSSDEDGFKGAWFVATVLKSPCSTTKRKGKALVEYQSLLSDDDEKKPLKEYIDEGFMRPLPPAAQATDEQSFELHDVVDAFYRDGWWKGVITKVTVLEDKKSHSKRYTVVFENPPDQIDFGPSDLRFHLDWTNGIWVRPPKQQRMESLKFSTGMDVEVNLGNEYPNDHWFPAIVLEEVGFNSFLLKCSSLSNNNEIGFMTVTVDSFHIRPPPPNLGVKNFELLEKVDAFYGSCWRPGSITKILVEGRYIVLLKHEREEKEFIHSEIRPHMYFMNGNWVNAIKDISITAYSQEQSGHANNNNAESPEVNSLWKCPKSTKRKLSAVKKVTQTALRHEAAISRPSKKSKRENSAIPLSSQASHVKSMPIETSNQKAEVTSGKLFECLNDPMVCKKPSADNSLFRGENADINQEEAGVVTEMIISLEERGRLPSACIKSQQFPAAGELDNTNRDSAEDIVDIEHGTREVDISVAIAEGMRVTHAENFYVLADKESNLHREGDANQQQKGEEHNLTGGGASKEDFATKKAELPTITGVEPAETSALASPTVCMENEVNVIIAGSSCGDPNDDQHLSLCIEGHSPCKTVNQWNDTGYRQVETAMQSPVRNVSVNSELVEYQEMPFVKSSSIWENIESLEAFQLMPQKPHFHPLVKYAELGREGLAIGHMVTFATLVEKTSKLKVDDSKSKFDSLLEAIADLESLGFDVKAVVDRINKLLSIKDRRGQLQDQSKNVEIQISDHTHEKTRLEEDIVAIDKMISELEEKRAFHTSMKEKKESEITTLQTNACVIDADIWKTEHDFESLAAAPWSRA